MTCHVSTRKFTRRAYRKENFGLLIETIHSPSPVLQERAVKTAFVLLETTNLKTFRVQTPTTPEPVAYTCLTQHLLQRFVESHDETLAQCDPVRAALVAGYLAGLESGRIDRDLRMILLQLLWELLDHLPAPCPAARRVAATLPRLLRANTTLLAETVAILPDAFRHLADRPRLNPSRRPQLTRSKLLASTRPVLWDVLGLATARPEDTDTLVAALAAAGLRRHSE